MAKAPSLTLPRPAMGLVGTVACPSCDFFWGFSFESVEEKRLAFFTMALCAPSWLPGLLDAIELFQNQMLSVLPSFQLSLPVSLSFRITHSFLTTLVVSFECYATGTI